MIDANVIVSAILFPQSIVSEIIKHIILYNKLTLSQYTIDEVKEVFYRKFPHRVNEMEKFIKNLPYELFMKKQIKRKIYPKIRDLDDLPVLINAIQSDVDLFITGDKDFNDIIIKKPKIMDPRKYFNKYMK